MVLVRIVFHARHGKINQLVRGMVEATYSAPEYPRNLTDLSGRMDTRVMESRHASLVAYERWRQELFASDAFRTVEAQGEEPIESGLTEFYTIERK